jgi:hypothetical protein
MNAAPVRVISKVTEVSTAPSGKLCVKFEVEHVGERQSFRAVVEPAEDNESREQVLERAWQKIEDGVKTWEKSMRRLEELKQLVGKAVERVLQYS